MEAIEFVIKYKQYLTEIEQVVKPEYQPVIEKLRDIDPHDIVRPEHYFNSEAEVVYRMFLRQIQQ